MAYSNLTIEELDILIEEEVNKSVPPEHAKLINEYMPELMVAARAEHGEIEPCSGYNKWTDCVAVYTDFNKVMFNYNDKTGNTHAACLPIKVV